MRVSVFGLGYVGAVTAACLAKLGHDVIGFDINEIKVAKLKTGEATIKEEGLDILLKEAVQNGKFTATNDIDFAVKNSEISFICVRTPQKEDDDLDITEIQRVCDNISNVLLTKRGNKHIIVTRILVVKNMCNQKKVIPNAAKKTNFIRSYF